MVLTNMREFAKIICSKLMFYRNFKLERLKSDNLNSYFSSNYTTSTNHISDDGMESNQNIKKLFGLLKVEETVSFNELLRNLGSSGIRISDPRLVLVHERARERNIKNDSDKMDFETFAFIINGREGLIQKAICDDFIIPDFSLFCKHLNDIYQICRTNTAGVMSHWPYPDNTSQYFSYGAHGSDYWGVSVCSIDGQQHDIGDYDVVCPLHSCSWPFNYAFAIKQLGFGEVHRFVGRGMMYANPVVDSTLHYSNPLNVVGSLVVSSLLLKNCNNLKEKFSETLHNYKQLVGGRGNLKFSEEVFDVANTWSHKTKSVAHHLANINFFPEGLDLDECVTFQLQTNCLSVDVQSGAIMAASLANYGRRPTENSDLPMLDPLAIRNILTFMQSSSQFSRSLRLPIISSSTGMNMVVVNGVMGLCLWSPSLDNYGISVRAMQFCKEFAKRFTTHKFNLSNVKSQRIYLGDHKSFSKASHIGRMMNYAYRGDEESLRYLHKSGMRADIADCDGRTALHVSCSEGHLDCVKYLVDVCCVPLDTRDRWGNTPLDEAVRYDHENVKSFLEGKMKT